ncbi:hypothetical protein BV20DRAFT_908500, partial [Pilatotrama ljubarskyi]
MLTLARIPTEIWREITTLACTDGGFTGRSLALASKFFHSQSLSTRFHSLLFDSLQRIEDFLAFLRLQPEDCKPRIAHLYLSFANEPVSSKPHLYLVYTSMSPDARAEYDAKAKAAKALWDERFCHTTAALLTLAAPALKTLCLVEDCLLLPLEFHCTFPRLEELSWKGYIQGLLPANLALYDSPLKFPALKRIHFMGYGKAEVVRALSKAVSSSLMHLRISQIHAADHELPDALAHALGIPTPSLAAKDEDDAVGDPSSGRRAVAATLPRLHNVTVHCTADSSGWCGHNSTTWNRFLDRFEMLARICEQRPDSTSVVLFTSPGRRKFRWPDRLLDDWIDRIEGRPGCWVRSKEE